MAFTLLRDPYTLRKRVAGSARNEYGNRLDSVVETVIYGRTWFTRAKKRYDTGITETAMCFGAFQISLDSSANPGVNDELVRTNEDGSVETFRIFGVSKVSAPGAGISHWRLELETVQGEM